ncbi:K02A2.6-like [Cordylochernes scorpioides]|uniref:K02A2.6-like n=1 Tax=Cordylochernes scorpioides TaxID=51811 RepID=A0ABY6KN00_9ARAC|nr:K02A2.6-like [Cordylochernes scorpioides]
MKRNQLVDVILVHFLQQKLSENLRTYPVAITADIEKMYRQIRIHPEDADYQRILWRPSPEEPVVDYRLLTWRLARILEVYPGSDQKVRVAQVRAATGVYLRPITKLAPLPFKSEPGFSGRGEYIDCRDTFPVPAAADLQVNLAGGKVFSKLDLKDAYQQLVVDEETAELLAINTHKGLFKVVSDNGRMFVGHEFQEFLMMNGIRHITSAPYHPQTNGQAERVVQTLKQLIRKNGWEYISVTLPRALFAMRTTPHGTTGLTPAELLMGRKLTTRMNRLHPKESEDSENGKEHFQNRFKSQENVYARKYNGKGKWEPEKIKTVLGPRNYEVIMENGVTAKRHQDQLMRRVKEEVSEDVEKKEECNTERMGEQMNDPNESQERLEETPGPSRPIRNRRLPEYLKDCVTNWG